MKDLPPNLSDVEGFDLRGFAPHQVYDVSTRLAELLIVLSYAEPEMRRQERATSDDRSRRRDRRSAR
jgi:hypothetical protein